MKGPFKLAYHNIVRDFKQVKVLFSTIVIGMILMICGYVSITAFINYREELNNAHSTNYDLALFDLSGSVKDMVVNDPNGDIKNYYLINNKGYAKLEPNGFNMKNYLFIQDMSSDNMYVENFDMIAGVLPKSHTEIIVPLEYSKLYDVSVGETAQLNVGSLEYNNTPSHKYLSRLEINNDTNFTFEYIEGENVTYTVVGIYKPNNDSYITDMYLNHYYAYSLLDYEITNEDTVDLLLTFKNKVLHTDYAYKFGATSYNGIYSMASFESNNIGFSSDFKMITYILVSVLILSILFFSLYTAFKFGNTERKMYFTQLMTIGVTSKELKEAWDIQAFVVSLVAIPFGICLSLITLYFSMTIGFSDIDINSLVFNSLSSSVMAIMAAVMLILVFVVNKLTEETILYLFPLDSIKGKTEKIKTKFVRYSNVTKLNGEISKYVKSNFSLKLNMPSQTYIFTVALSVSMLILLISFNNIATKPVIDYIENNNSSLVLKVEGEDNYYNFIKEVSTLEQVVDYSITRESDIFGYTYLDNLNLLDLTRILVIDDTNLYRLPIKIVSINDEKFVKYGGTTQNFVMLNEIKISNKDTTTINNLPTGTNHGFVIKDLDGNELYNFEQYFVTENRGYELDAGYYTILVKDSYLNEMVGKETNYNKIYLEVSNDKLFYDILDDLLKDKYSNLNINVLKEDVDILTVSSAIYVSYVTVYITLFVTFVLFIISLVSYIKNYEETRVKELGLLKSMGASSSELKSVIQKEVGRGYLIASIAGLILGVCINFVLLQFFEVSNLNVDIQFTKVTIYCVGIISVLLLIIFNISVSKATKNLRKCYPFELMKDNFREF